MSEQDSMSLDVQETDAIPLRMRQMHAAYGRVSGKQCGKCVHFLRVQYAKVYRKCGKTVMTGGPGTDWLASWQACGLYVETKEKKVTYAAK